MALDFSIRSKTNVSIITPQINTYDFSTCALLGVFSLFPTTGNLYKIYNNSDDVYYDFHQFINSANSIRTNDRIAWLIAAAKRFFDQSPKPQQLMICRIDPSYIDNNALPDYENAFIELFDNVPNFYSCTLVDTVAYNDPNIGEAISWLIYSFTHRVVIDGYKSVLFANCKDPQAVLNGTKSDVDIYNLTCHKETNSTDPPQDLPFIKVCYHSLNMPYGAGGGGSDSDSSSTLVLPFNPSNVNFNTENFAAALMGAFFTNPFGRSLTEVSLKNVFDDPLITFDTLPIITFDTATGLGKYATAYFDFSNHVNSAFSSPQYGTMASSRVDEVVYLDQIVTKDYAEKRTKSDILNYFKTTKNIYYDDVGIVAFVSILKTVLQSMVDAGMILPFKNSDISFPTYVDIVKNTPSDIQNRILNKITAQITFATHIQKSLITVNLNIVQ
jgi:hypothetical protein